ncbi:DMT family transporter [Bacillus thuringiensis]|uniref:DMT family transporter n=1 Tax=Bacillus cereus group TaxID=86661 RepID=UPI000BEC9228|nr:MULTISPECIES: DMT family transporter [Bacillus cereus group]PEE11057.1 multidrug transporter [Bacillus cereus]PFL58896.1 multidrug transporter [Bacillus cereus]PFV36471.1 multidrug transporter [Bacillus thuringiensis]PGX85274.1 multidrug transporter [Bacillus thuringiensis]HDR8066144.1 DMT family transporter [Bacillus cereus]
MKNNIRKGMLLGCIGVICFSLTLPATRTAVPYFGEAIVGLGRVVIAAIIVGIIFIKNQEKIPNKDQMKSLWIVAIGAVLAFPLLSTYAMKSLPVSHGAIEVALLPLATAGFATWRGGEQLSKRYWIASIISTITVLLYAVYLGLGQLQMGDIALIAAVLILGLSYAEGGKLSKDLGSWKVIAWANLIGAPFFIIPVGLSISSDMLQAPIEAWISLFYLAIISQFLAYIAWYGGMSLGGIAKVGQLQYLQPFLMIIFSVLFLGESITWLTIVLAFIVVICVIVGKSEPSVKKESYYEKHVLHK